MYIFELLKCKEKNIIVNLISKLLIQANKLTDRRTPSRKYQIVASQPESVSRIEVTRHR